MSREAQNAKRTQGPVPGDSPAPALSALPTVLAIDPGRAKCGLAVVDASGEVLYRSVVSTAEIVARLTVLAGRFHPEAVLLGDGTGAQAVQESISALEIPVTHVDERHTSEEARSLYLDDHRPRGWQRLIPRGLRTPGEPYDDYVAVILARRWWAAQRETRTAEEGWEECD